MCLWEKGHLRSENVEFLKDWSPFHHHQWFSPWTLPTFLIGGIPKPVVSAGSDLLMLESGSAGWKSMKTRNWCRWSSTLKWSKVGGAFVFYVCFSDVLFSSLWCTLWWLSGHFPESVTNVYSISRWRRVEGNCMVYAFHVFPHAQDQLP